MELIRILIVFAIILVVMAWKNNITAAVTAAIVGTIVLYQLPLAAAWSAFVEGAIGPSTLETIAVFYSVTYLQRMMEDRGNLTHAQTALNGLFNNRRINASLAPCLMGCLPSPSAILICGPLVRESVGDSLSTPEKAAVTSYFRHVSESFLPTYASIFIAIGMTNGAVTAGTFVLAMLPVVAFLFLAGYIIYLRRVPKDTGMKPDQTKGTYARLLVRSIWPIALAILLILIFNLSVYGAVLVCVFLNAFAGHFSPKELVRFVRTAFEGRMLLSTWIILVFKEILAATGAINAMPEIFAELPLPSFLLYTLIFFCGAVLVGSQGIIVLCMPMAIASLNGAPVLPLFILLMTICYVASQVSPTHICLPLCAQDYDVPLGKMLLKTFPMVVLVTVFAFGYYFLLTLLCAG